MVSSVHLPQDVGYQHGKVVFTGWARGDIIQNMLKDHHSADYNDSKITDVSPARTDTGVRPPRTRRLTEVFCRSVLHVLRC